MSLCSKYVEGLNRRLDEKLSIDQIADELCNDNSKKRDKIIKSIKIERGGDWLIENCEWLGYNKDKIRNMNGVGGLPRVENPTQLNRPSLNTKKPPSNKYDEWITTLSNMCVELEWMNEEFENTTEAKWIRKTNALAKRVKELKMILQNRVR